MDNKNSISFVSDERLSTFFTTETDYEMVREIEEFIDKDKTMSAVAGFVCRVIPEKLTISVASVPKLIGSNYVTTDIQYSAQLIYRRIMFNETDLPYYNERYFHLSYFRNTMIHKINEEIRNILDEDQSAEKEWKDIPIDVSIATEQQTKTIGSFPNFYSETTYLGFLLYETVYQ